MPDTLGSIVQLVTVVIIFIVVLAVTLLATRYIAGFQKSASLHSNIEVLETFRLANNKYIQVVRIGERYVAVAIGREEVTKLAEFGLDELIYEREAPKEMPDFKTVLSKLTKPTEKTKL